MFTDNLVESRSNRLEARRVAVLPVVAGAHAALAAALVLASVWSLQYVTEPPIIIIPNIPVKLMPPPGRGDQPKPPAGTERPRPNPATAVTPLVIPETAPVIYDSAAQEPGDGTGVVGGIVIDGSDDGGWDPNGTPGGLSVPRPPEPESGPLAIGGDIKAPVRLAPLVPVYPETARKAGKQGVVVLRLTIDKEGRVTEVAVVSGLPFGLTQAAVDAARTLECYFDLSVEFRIN
jgi:protein TonB